MLYCSVLINGSVAHPPKVLNEVKDWVGYGKEEQRDRRDYFAKLCASLGSHPTRGKDMGRPPLGVGLLIAMR